MKIYTVIITIIISLFLFTPYTLQAEINNKDKKEIDISVNPSPVLFHLKNVKPGDTITRNLTIKNKGKQDFNYLFTNTFLRGSEKFYNELILKISDGKKNLVEGRIKDFNKMDLRHLKSSSSETFGITIEIPYELGNEYQGLTADFQFDFLVEGKEGSVTPVIEGNALPNTGTDIFKYFILGSVLFFTGFIIYMVARSKIALPIIPFKEKKEV
jgi:Camelysin metallo-endopeptidase